MGVLALKKEAVLCRDLFTKMHLKMACLQGLAVATCLAPSPTLL